MKKNKQFRNPLVHSCRVGCGDAGDGCWGAFRKTDTGLFNRACYLSGSYGLNRLPLDSDWGLSLLLCGKS